MTFREVSLWAVGELEELPSSRIEAEVIICHVMGWKRHELYLNHTEQVPAGKLAEIRRCVAARSERIPLQHLTGSVEFMDLCFHASSSALIPRPETEVLLSAFTDILPPSPNLLIDAGTGSGILAICLALKYSSAMVLGTDISFKALSLAMENQLLHEVSNLCLVQAELLAPFSFTSPSFDGIVANLPYVESDIIQELEPEVRDHDPLMALDGGADGLDIIRRILVQASRLLRPGGALALELDPGQATAVRDLMILSGNWDGIEMIPDLSGRLRVVRAQGRR